MPTTKIFVINIYTIYNKQIFVANYIYYEEKLKMILLIPNSL